MCFNNKDNANEVAAEHQMFGSSEEDMAGNANNLSDNLLQIPQQPQQQPVASVVNWERYLPVRSLKVLLVENDDSTRHIVSALLKNCSYEVTAVSNAFEAWIVLEDENSHIDFVLTEVIMPVESGTDLLCKIMSHKTLKNIPVIMMSSHDSMATVFSCLSKGAVDFLIKPIRKNELKNLWQHVWRRCHTSSGGSVTESGTENKRLVKTESTEESGNDTSISNGDGSDNGSGTQSSWNKRAGDFNRASPSYEFPDAPNRKGNEELDDFPSLKLTQTIQRDAGDSRDGEGDDVLRHSDHSASSKYNTATKALTEKVGSCSPHGSFVAKMIGSSSSSNPLNQHSKGSSRCENNDTVLAAECFNFVQQHTGKRQEDTNGESDNSNGGKGSERRTQIESGLMKFSQKRKER